MGLDLGRGVRTSQHRRYSINLYTEYGEGTCPISRSELSEDPETPDPVTPHRTQNKTSMMQTGITPRLPSQTAATNAAVSAARRNYHRWKGKKHTYQDDPEEHEGLLEDGGSHDSEGGVRRASPARLHTQEARSASCIP